ncbi:MAG TPA: SDR family NAD(P)-dependent oxidoreductase [Roseiarcus sp.]|nr:SDR family NAD(P)-dependent oxidoreductase [Roseiarcus sp.]
MTKNIIITGASSGLGRALALEYAAPSRVLGLLGRDEHRLHETAERVRRKGAVAQTASIDVRDRDGMRSFLLDFDAAAPIDLLIASAGVTMVTPAPGEVEDLTKSPELFEVNVGGVMNTLAPVAPLMRRRRAGQIAVFGSIAAFAPPPDSPSYAASKAALVAFALATRALYRADGVSISVVCPGFVDTPMAASYSSWKPLSMSAEQAAKRIRRGLDRRKAIIAFPLPLYVAARLQQWLPDSLRIRTMLRYRAAARAAVP